MNKTLANIKEVAEQLRDLYNSVYQMYDEAVESMIHLPRVTERQVEHLLDNLLDFCDDYRFLELYKKLCRHVMSQYPQLVKDYIHLYHTQYGDCMPDFQIRDRRLCTMTTEFSRLSFIRNCNESETGAANENKSDEMIRRKSYVLNHIAKRKEKL